MHSHRLVSPPTQYGVDFVLSGHVHAYERFKPVYNYSLNPCGSIHITSEAGSARCLLQRSRKHGSLQPGAPALAATATQAWA